MLSLITESIQFSTYRSFENKIQIDYPIDWVVTENEKNEKDKDVSFMEPGEESDLCFFYEDISDTTFEEYNEKNYQEMVESLPNVEVLEKLTLIKIAGLDFFKSTFKSDVGPIFGVDEPLLVKQMTLVALLGQICITFILSSSDDLFDEYWIVFEKMLNSFKFLR
ncbi:MAG: hypothetical protein GF383_08065 [Candidatus Lokiarchaeota archaeon]|nr:hypothetical protein [Candidatus Lokiarchaeota archaeon]MBD3340287.1 hypothetical protein [Candidatus Lokiarchaeota archaeon]